MRFENSRQHFSHALSANAKLDLWLLHFDHVGKTSQSSQRRSVGQLKRYDFVTAKSVDDSFQRTIVIDLASGNDHHALAKRFDVLHVVAGQEDGRFALLLIVLEELLDLMLSHDVEADGWFVQKQHVRLMQQRRDQLHLHPFTE